MNIHSYCKKKNEKLQGDGSLVIQGDGSLVTCPRVPWLYQKHMKISIETYGYITYDLYNFSTYFILPKSPDGICAFIVCGFYQEPRVQWLWSIFLLAIVFLGQRDEVECTQLLDTTNAWRCSSGCLSLFLNKRIHPSESPINLLLGGSRYLSPCPSEHKPDTYRKIEK